MKTLQHYIVMRLGACAYYLRAGNPNRALINLNQALDLIPRLPDDARERACELALALGCAAIECGHGHC